MPGTHRSRSTERAGSTHRATGTHRSPGDRATAESALASDDASTTRVRTVLVASSSRADWAHLRWPLAALAADPRLEPRLALFGPHCSPRFGGTADAAEAAARELGVPVEARLSCLVDGDAGVDAARTLGLATLAWADLLDRVRPDVLLVVADRFEMLAPANAATIMRVPIAHLEGGEASEGAIDQSIRDALTKCAHLHLAPTALAAQRLVSMGEPAVRIRVVGAPSLDQLRRGALEDPQALGSALGIDLRTPGVLAAFHPETLPVGAGSVTGDLPAFLGALELVATGGDGEPAVPVRCLWPNADEGGRSIIDALEDLAERTEGVDVIVNLPPVRYWSLLAASLVVAGNSSSGIMESPTLGVPAVNVGDRQQGRERAANVIDVPAGAEAPAIAAAIRRAASDEFRAIARDATSPFGDGRASERIAEALATMPLGAAALRREATAIRPDAAASAPAAPWSDDEARGFAGGRA